MNVDNQSAPMLLNALENERRFTANELHDGVAQTTLQLGLQAGICRKLMEHNQLDMLATELAQLEERVQVASNQVKALIQDLRPPVIDTDTPDLQQFIEYAIEVHHQRGGAPVTFLNKLDADIMLSQPQMLGLMRIVQERLLLVRKYAQAGQVQITLWAEPDILYLRITDNGRKFDAVAVNGQAGAKNGAGAGMVNLQTRTSAVGGTLNIAANPDGDGTKITVQLPL
jgi:signal transduction histidine kinase